MRHAQPGSAIFAALSPAPSDANVLELLRAIEHGIRVLDWRFARGKARDYPEPLPLPWDPAPEGAIKGDAMTWDEAADFLGWGEEMSRYFND